MTIYKDKGAKPQRSLHARITVRAVVAAMGILGMPVNAAKNAQHVDICFGELHWAEKHS